MPQAGLHAAFGNQFRRFLSHKRRLFPAIIFGAILPDYIRCKVIEILENGDHPLFLAEVIGAEINKDAVPLELRNTGWSYGG